MRNGSFLDYILHGLYFTLYGLFKYWPSPIGDPFRLIVSKPFLRKSGRLRIYEGVTLWYPYRLRIGKNVTFNENVYISSYGDVTIGDDVRIGNRTAIISSDHICECVDRPFWQQGLAAKPVIIEDNVFIGCNCTIMGGVKIGRDSVIGAGSVVTRDVETGTVVAGNPAKLIRRLSDKPEG